MSERPEDSVLHAAPRVNRLSDSIYELYNPGASSRLNVVFFHGLQLSDNSDSHLSTWTSRGSQQEVWPMTWLPEEFPEARILCVNYDSCIRRSAEHGRLDLHNAAEMLMVNLKLARVFQHPTILIGHSYGGLVIKQLCLEAHTWRHIGDDGEDAWVLESTRPYMGEEGEDASVLNCIKGVFFYGTPHHGSSVFSTIIDLKDASLLLDFVHVLCAVSARLHQIFDSLRWTHKWRIAGVGELKPTLTPTLTPVSECG
ncbi:protein SERAC1 [Marchantia polymorpha subsp. ruderalis]